MGVVERTSGLGGVTVERDVAAVMRDGITLRADVYRPETPGEYPVLVQRTPYNKVIAQNICFQHPAWYARQGYIVVVQDTRGRFASDGEFNPYHLGPRTAPTPFAGRRSCPEPPAASPPTGSPIPA
jgi:predicted acyl esterase